MQTIVQTDMTTTLELGDTTACFTLADIIQTACDWHGITISELRGPLRTKRMNHIRQIVISKATKLGYTHEEIGQAINRTRSTVSHLARNAK